MVKILLNSYKTSKLEVKDMSSCLSIAKEQGYKEIEELLSEFSKSVTQ